MKLLNSRRNALDKAGIWAAVILLTAAVQTWAAQTPSTKEGQRASVEDLFDNTRVFAIQIEISEKNLGILRGYHWRGFRGGPAERPAVTGTVREGTNVYSDVSIHLKGAAGSFKSVDEQPSLTLNFDKHVKGQTFHGVERISLNNSVQDRSLLNEQFCRELFAAAGVPVPRATHARVSLNGRGLGVYVLVEAFNKQFLARHFQSAQGNLYDGGFLKDVNDRLEKSSGSGPDDWSDLRRLADAAGERNVSNRVTRLAQVLDWDQFITYMALDVMMCDWDGYAINKNNYRVYHDPTRERFVFMPHGLDQMFGVMRARTDMPLFPRMQGLVARAVLQTPQGRQQYLERIAQLTTNLFQPEIMTNRVWQLAAKLRPTFDELGPNSVRYHQALVADFCDRIVARARSVREQLAGTQTTLQFSPTGVARITEWTPRVEHGKPVLDERTESGRKTLHIAAANGSAVGTWVARVPLEPGHYRLEANVKSLNVTPDPGDRRAGAGLRISGRRFIQKLTATVDWTALAFEFDIEDAPTRFGFMEPIDGEGQTTELICELRAAKGEAWFDRESIRLIRK